MKKKASKYSLGIVAILIAIVIVLNVFMSLLPDTATEFDISSSRLYSVSSSTKAVVDSLDDDVTIYWITQAGEEDSIIEKLLSRYDALSDKVTVVKKDPDIYPTFAQQYTSDTVSNNDIIVECGDTYRYISTSDIYEYDNVNYYTGSYDYYFDGEGEITSAIDYVTCDELSTVYRLVGHGESELSTKFSSQIEKDNIQLLDLSLPSLDEIPEDCEAIIIYAPTSDISDIELEMLLDYVQGGGKILAFIGPQQETQLENFNAILSAYGITAEEGLLVETETNYYAYGMPYVLIPELGSDEITTSISEESGYVLVPLAQALSNSGSNNGATVTSLLSSSSDALNKIAGFSLDTYEVEDGDTVGCFDVGIKITDGNGEIIWVSSSYFLDETYNSYSSGSNLDFAMNCVSELVGEQEHMAIRAKSLNYEYLTISESSASFLRLIMIIIIPLIFAVFGVIEMIQRRRLR